MIEVLRQPTNLPVEAAMTDPVRVRYAPSPTGIPHVGNIRTALFNWLFARNHGGSFIVRIEDTDRARLVEGATEAILESLRWLGIDWDEGPTGDGYDEKGGYGPYFQSNPARLERYSEAAQRLIGEDKAYACYCTPEELGEMRKAQQKRGEPPKYDGRHRDDAELRAKHEAEGRPKVVRFKSRQDGETAFNDLIRGEISFQNSLLDDFVILKSDGFPTYHLAHIVDDHAMEISHVLRADEWISSAPRHVMLHQALGWIPPAYAHLPIILGPDRSKLSKRHGATSVLEYRDQGFLPQTLMNFLALLGWSYDDQTEIFTREQLIEYFSLERVGKAGAIFNNEKLEWMNGVYIRGMDPAELTPLVAERLEQDLPDSVAGPLDQAYLSLVVPLIQDRLKLLSEARELTEFFVTDELAYETELLLQKNMDAGGTLYALEAAAERIAGLPDFEAATLETALRALAEELQIKTGQLFGTLRVACTGLKAAPPLFETMAVLGRERCMPRIAKAIERWKPRVAAS